MYKVRISSYVYISSSAPCLQFSDICLFICKIFSFPFLKFFVFFLLPASSTTEACTPKAQMVPAKKATIPTSSRSQTAKKIASLIKNPSVLKPKNQAPLPGDKSVKATSVRRWVSTFICIQLFLFF